MNAALSSATSDSAATQGRHTSKLVAEKGSAVTPYIREWYDLLAARRRGQVPRHAGLGGVWVVLGDGVSYQPPLLLRLPADGSWCNVPFHAIAGLDVMLCFDGLAIRYGTLQNVISAICSAGPRRFVAFDLAFGKTAHLVLGANHGV